MEKLKVVSGKVYGYDFTSKTKKRLKRGVNYEVLDRKDNGWYIVKGINRDTLEVPAVSLRGRISVKGVN